MKEEVEKSARPAAELEGLLHRSSLEISPSPTVALAEDAAFPPASQSKGKGKQKSTPIPYMQVALVALYKGSQPMLFAVVMPYLPALLINELKLADEVDLGHYAGMVEMATAVGQGIGVPFMARISDTYGRRSVTLIGVAIACFTSCIFGFAKSFPLLITLRFCLGLANSASAATTKVMLAEITDHSNQAKSFAYLGMGWQTNAVMAPLVGGLFSRPAETFSIFKGSIFQAYPYALPTIVAALPPILALIVGIFYLEETLPSLRNHSKGVPGRPGHVKSKRSDYTAVSAEGGSPMFEDDEEYDEKSEQLVAAPKGLLHRARRFYRSLYETKDGIPGLFSGGLPFVLFLWFLLVVVVLSLETAQLLLLFSSNALGGLGLTKSGMSVFLALRPLMVCAYEINVFPRISKRFGYEAVFKALICLPPITCTLYLLVSSAALNGLATSAWFIGVFLGVSLVLQCVTNPVFLAIDILLPSRAAHSSQLSTGNALVEIVAQCAVASGAAFGSSLFAWSAALSEESWFRGRAVWLGLIAYTLFAAAVSQKLTHIPGWREREQSEQLPKEERNDEA